MLGPTILGACGRAARIRTAASGCLLGLCALLAGCGQTGPLYLPAPPPAPAGIVPPPPAPASVPAGPAASAPSPTS
ncbi:MAG: lipoprotein [Betaproteobacteria bacterium]|nr:lipoprotein [Betaproteobacteria bacterium]